LRLVCDQHELVSDFVSKIIGLPYDFKDCKTIAMFDEKGVVVGVIYDGFTCNSDATYANCNMHVAARKGSKWATRDFLYHAFSYPFNFMNCNRVTATVEQYNEKALKLNRRLGFKDEGVHREAYNGNDMIILGMLKRECKWLDYIQVK
jgi:RimJ/RimL family protein N-acetyltransferase